MRWEIFCRVVDNFGDIGFAWRLAADLAARRQQVRLIVDDPTALQWLAPHGAAGVGVTAWPGSDDSWAEVAVETFGCGRPERTSEAAVAINVEHLSAESFVERSHGLPSPRRHSDGLLTTTWLYYPGFNERTGGLLREGDAVVEANAEKQPSDERRVVVFCYANEALDALFQALGDAPTLVLACPGAAADAARSALGASLARGRLHAELLPFLAQPDFDVLLRSADVNFVRGEDSLVRAIWAGRPFVWQLYPQADGAHIAKLEAFLDVFLAAAPAELAQPLRVLFRRWNGIDSGPLVLPAFVGWQQHCRGWRAKLAAQADLTAGLVRFAHARR